MKTNEIHTGRRCNPKYSRPYIIFLLLLFPDAVCFGWAAKLFLFMLHARHMQIRLTAAWNFFFFLTFFDFFPLILIKACSVSQCGRCERVSWKGDTQGKQRALVTVIDHSFTALVSTIKYILMHLRVADGTLTSLTQLLNDLHSNAYIQIPTGSSETWRATAVLARYAKMLRKKEITWAAESQM